MMRGLLPCLSLTIVRFDVFPDQAFIPIVAIIYAAGGFGASTRYSISRFGKIL